MTLGLEREIVDRATYEKSVRHLKDRNVRLPKISELADPARHLKSRLPSWLMLTRIYQIRAICFVCIGTMVRIGEASLMCPNTLFCRKR